MIWTHTRKKMQQNTDIQLCTYGLDLHLPLCVVCDCSSTGLCVCDTYLLEKSKVLTQFLAGLNEQEGEENLCNDPLKCFQDEHAQLHLCL